jgi:hypothetical protein
VLLIAAITPGFHGRNGPLDELELCLAPIVIVIALLAYRWLSQRATRKGKSR